MSMLKIIELENQVERKDAYIWELEAKIKGEKEHSLNVLNGAFYHAHIEREGIAGEEMDADIYHEYIRAVKADNICNGKHCFRMEGYGHSPQCLKEAEHNFSKRG